MEKPTTPISGAAAASFSSPIMRMRYLYAGSLRDAVTAARSSLACAIVVATLPSYRSGASAVKPSLAKRSHRPRKKSFSPHQE